MFKWSKTFFMLNLTFILLLSFIITSCEVKPKTNDDDDEKKTYTYVESVSWLKPDTSTVSLDAPDVRINGADDWRDEIIYFIMTDRFADGDKSNNETLKRPDGNEPLHDPTDINKYHGGDLKGISDNIDYLRRLGVTSVWITPVVQNIREDDGKTGYHGYWAQDMTKIDPHLADTTSDYQSFVDTMHDNGLLVIQDIVVNHMANLALYKIDGKENWDPSFKSGSYGDAAHLFIEDSSHAGDGWIEVGLRTKPSAPFDQASFYNNCGKSDTNVCYGIIKL